MNPIGVDETKYQYNSPIGDFVPRDNNDVNIYPILTNNINFFINRGDERKPGR